MKTKGKLMLAAILIVASLLVLFINSSDKNSNSDFMDSSKLSEFGQKGLFPIRYYPKWHTQAQFLGIYMAIDKGFYRQYGLDVQLMPHQPDREVIDNILSGYGEVAHLDLLAAIKENSDSTRIVNIGQISQKSSIMLVAKKSRGIKSLSDFEGKKIGIWRSTSNLITTTYLANNKLNMQIVPVDWSINLFLQDVVDVINVMKYNEYHQLIQAGLDPEDLFIQKLDSGEYNIPDEGFYVSKEFYQAHPEQCKAFTEATMDGWMYAFTNPTEAVNLVLEMMQQQKMRANKTHQFWMLTEMKNIVLAKPQSTGKLHPDDFAKAKKLLRDNKLITRDISYQEFCPNAAK